jgi:GxxExxY protein
VSGAIIGAAIEVHRQLGPGLLESAYEVCLERELTIRGLGVERQRMIPVRFRGIRVPRAYRMDFVVNRLVAVEIKAVDRVLQIHEAQLLSYLRLSNLKLGLLINFRVGLLKHGIKRLRLF